MTPEEKRARHAAYMREYYSDPGRREKKREKDREYAAANRERARKKSNDWYQRNRQRALDRIKEYRVEIQRLAHEAKSKPCHDCGQSFPVSCMQFHHLDPSTKKGEVCNRSSPNQAIEEMAKCIVICANCHCLRHS